MTDEELIARLLKKTQRQSSDDTCAAYFKRWETLDNPEGPEAAKRIEELLKERDEAWKRAEHAEKMWGSTEVTLTEAINILEDALQEAGDDYPGSTMQSWCQQQIKQARKVRGK